MAAYEDFLNDLFEGAPDHAWVLIWTLSGKKSAWFTAGDVPAACEYIKKGDKKNIFVGVGLAPKPCGRMPSKMRCEADKIIGLPALYVDIDFKDPVHAKEALPADVDEALELMGMLPIKPSYIIHTGHGIHGWWIFKEPWIFEDDEDRQRAAALSERWVALLKSRAIERGWTADSVFDLARVLRLPGTINAKEGAEAVEARVLEKNDYRYNPEDFEAILDDLEAAGLKMHEGGARPGGSVDKKLVETIINGLMVSMSAEPPVEKFEAMYDNDDDFRVLWKMQRGGKWSPSQYDMALAHKGVQVDWDDQEIANLIIAWRRRHKKEPEKCWRKKYLAGTIAKARQWHASTNAEQIVSDSAALSKAKPKPKQDKGQKKNKIDPEVLEALSTTLGLPGRIRKIIKWGEEDPTYSIILENGEEIKLPSIDFLMSQTRLRNRIAAAIEITMNKVPGKKWDGITQAMLNCVEVEKLGPESTLKGQIGIWVEEYLAHSTVYEDMNEYVENEATSPFLYMNRMYFRLDPFVEWLAQRKGSRESRKVITAMLRENGMCPVNLRIKIEESFIKIRAWRINDDGKKKGKKKKKPNSKIIELKARGQ